MGRTFYLDLEFGNDANDGLSFATRWRSPTGGPTAARIAPGDTIRVRATTLSSSTGFNATFTNGIADIAIPAGYIKSVCPCDALWTSADPTNCLVAADTSILKEGTASAKFVVKAAAVVGRMAYYTLPAALDLSSFNVLSFFIRTAGLATNGHFSIRLCSDTLGQTAVRSYAVCWYDYLAGAWGNTPPLNVFAPFYYDFGASIGAGIRSVALWMNTDISTTADFTLWIDNICAVKNASVPTLKHLIGTANSYGCGGDNSEPWYTIRFMSDTSIRLGYLANTLPSAAAPVYRGPTRTVPLYTRDTLAPAGAIADSAYALFPTSRDGARQAPITYSFGWNRSDMSTQSDATFLDLLGGVGYGMKISHSYINVERLGIVRSGYGLWATTGAHHCDLEIAATLGNSYHGVYCDANSYHMTARGRYSGFNGQGGVVLAGEDSTIQFGLIEASGTSGIGLDKGGRIIGPSIIRYNSVDGIWVNAPFYAEKITTVGNADGVYVGGRCNRQGVSLMRNCVLSEAIEVNGQVLVEGMGQVVWAMDHDGVRGNSRGWSEGGSWFRSSAYLHNPSNSAAWAGSTQDCGADNPMHMRYATLACKAGRPVTVSLWVYRLANAAARLVLKGQQIAGVDQDLVVERSGAAGAWEQMMASFTPSEDGSVDLCVQLYSTVPGSSASAYFDDFALAGAATLREMSTAAFSRDGQPLVAGGIGTVLVIDD